MLVKMLQILCCWTAGVLEHWSVVKNIYQPFSHYFSTSIGQHVKTPVFAYHETHL